MKGFVLWFEFIDIYSYQMIALTEKLTNFKYKLSMTCLVSSELHIVRKSDFNSNSGEIRVRVKIRVITVQLNI